MFCHGYAYFWFETKVQSTQRSVRSKLNMEFYHSAQRLVLIQEADIFWISVQPIALLPALGSLCNTLTIAIVFIWFMASVFRSQKSGTGFNLVRHPFIISSCHLMKMHTYLKVDVLLSRNRHFFFFCFFISSVDWNVDCIFVWWFGNKANYVRNKEKIQSFSLESRFIFA